jgi:hypothetical protein
MPAALDLCPLSLAINRYISLVGGASYNSSEKKKKKKAKRDYILITIQVFFSFSSQILIFIKNN